MASRGRGGVDGCGLIHRYTYVSQSGGRGGLCWVFFSFQDSSSACSPCCAVLCWACLTGVPRKSCIGKRRGLPRRSASRTSKTSPLRLWILFIICVAYYVTVFPFIGLATSVPNNCCLPIAACGYCLAMSICGCLAMPVLLLLIPSNLQCFF